MNVVTIDRAFGGNRERACGAEAIWERRAASMHVLIAATPAEEEQPRAVAMTGTTARMTGYGLRRVSSRKRKGRTTSTWIRRPTKSATRKRPSAWSRLASNWYLDPTDEMMSEATPIGAEASGSEERGGRSALEGGNYKWGSGGREAARGRHAVRRGERKLGEWAARQCQSRMRRLSLRRR